MRRAISKIAPSRKISNQPKPSSDLGIKPFIRKAKQADNLIAYQAYRFHIGFRAHRSHRRVFVERRL